MDISSQWWNHHGILLSESTDLKHNQLLYGSRERTIQEGLAQTWEYMDVCATDEGHLVLFDRSPHKAWEDKIFHRQDAYRGKAIMIWGM